MLSIWTSLKICLVKGEWLLLRSISLNSKESVENIVVRGEHVLHFLLSLNFSTI